MAENDEASGSEAADTPYVPSGLRRSTFTPRVNDAVRAAERPADAVVAEANTDAITEADVPGDAGQAAHGQVSEQLPDRPRRRSLDDDVLVRKLSPEAAGPGRTLDAIEELQAQLLLRQEEARQFSAWETGMRAIGTPEALETVAQAIPEFTGVIPIVSAEQIAEYQARTQPPMQVDTRGGVPPQPVEHSQPEPRAAADDTAPPPPAIPERPSVQYMNPEEYPPPRLEERVDAAPLGEPNLSDHLVLQPPWMRAPSSEEPRLLPETQESRNVEESEPAQNLEAAQNLQAAQDFRAPLEVQQPEESAQAEPLDLAPPIPEIPIPETPNPETLAPEALAADLLTPVPQASELLTPEAPIPELPEPEAPASQSLTPEPMDLSETPDPRAAPEVAGESEQPVEVSIGEGSLGDEPAADASAGNEPVENTSARDAPVMYKLVDPLPSGNMPLATPPTASLFDKLLSGGAGGTADEVAVPFSLLGAPQDRAPQDGAAQDGAAQDAAALVTGSQPIVLPVIDDEPDDDVDDVDRAYGEPFGTPSMAAEAVPVSGEESVAPGTGDAPAQPLATPRVQTGHQVLVDEPAPKQPVFGLELSGIDPTPLEHRVGWAARMFWLWFATNSSVVSIAFGAALLGLGMSLRQAVLAAFIGVAISFLPLGLGTLAGKWSGQPTIVVSRATFGLVGNIAPAVLALITRLFWGSVLLWLLAVCAARILVGASLAGPFNEIQLTLLGIALGFVIAFLVAFLGYPLFARLQLILSIVSAVLILGLFAVTWNTVDIRSALSIGDGPWILVITGFVMVFSFIGLVWANSSGDLARYQRRGSSGASASLWASFGATLPAFLLIAYGALLAASSPSLLAGLRSAPLDAIAALLPSWYPVPLLAATVLSLLSGVALSLYSGGFALQAVGMRLQRQWAVVVIGIVVFGMAVVMAVSDASLADVFRDLATSIAVPVAAWAGIFAAEMMIRRRHFDTDSLLRPGGVYPSVNWVNFTMLFVASALGFAFTSAAVSWLSWQGYGFVLLGIPVRGEVGTSDVGVLIALAVGLLTPLVVGVPAVRRQERSRR